MASCYQGWKNILPFSQGESSTHRVRRQYHADVSDHGGTCSMHRHLWRDGLAADKVTPHSIVRCFSPCALYSSPSHA